MKITDKYYPEVPLRQPTKTPSLKWVVVVIFFAFIAIILVFVAFSGKQQVPISINKDFVVAITKGPDGTPEILAKALGYSQQINIYAYNPEGSFINLYTISASKPSVTIPLQNYGVYQIRAEDDKQNVLYQKQAIFSGNISLNIKENKGINFARSGNKAYISSGSTVVLSNRGSIAVEPGNITINVGDILFESSLQGEKWMWPADLQSYRISKSQSQAVAAGKYSATLSVGDRFGNILAKEDIEITI
jgi:hypothetical protein